MLDFMIAFCSAIHGCPTCPQFHKQAFFRLQMFYKQVLHRMHIFTYCLNGYAAMGNHSWSHSAEKLYQNYRFELFYFAIQQHLIKMSILQRLVRICNPATIIRWNRIQSVISMKKLQQIHTILFALQWSMTC